MVPPALVEDSHPPEPASQSSIASRDPVSVSADHPLSDFRLSSHRWQIGLSASVGPYEYVVKGWRSGGRSLEVLRAPPNCHRQPEIFRNQRKLT